MCCYQCAHATRHHTGPVCRMQGARCERLLAALPAASPRHASTTLGCSTLLAAAPPGTRSSPSCGEQGCSHRMLVVGLTTASSMLAEQRRTARGSNASTGQQREQRPSAPALRSPVPPACSCALPRTCPSSLTPQENTTVSMGGSYTYAGCSKCTNDGRGHTAGNRTPAPPFTAAGRQARGSTHAAAVVPCRPPSLLQHSISPGGRTGCPLPSCPRSRAGGAAAAAVAAWP